MTPTLQEHGVGPARTMSYAPLGADGERVVISGMAGLYPQARYIKDLENILYNKVNPISAEGLRWQYNHPEAAQFAGNVPDLDRFDAQFFKVHYRLGNSMDSMSRNLLEQSYEAIYDAGLSPEHLSGKNVGVYVGTCFSETEKACFYVATSRTGFGIAGCSKAMFANRISYWLNAKGPSVSIDQACCSSTAALEQAYLAMSRGECEAAVVGGANLCLHPQSSVHFGRIMKASKDGKTKSFSQDAAGCVKSEAINVLFLQKAKDAKRIYANVVHVKSEFVSILNGPTGPRYGFYRNPEDTTNFLKRFYDEAGVSPRAVEYVEAFGSAVPEVDKSELEAIDKVFCKDRDVPLPVGSVMSNIGYGEAASGISAVTKVLLGYHKGELAGNLHCDIPNLDIPGLEQERMYIVTDNQRFQSTFTAVNSMSVTGVNAHVLLNGYHKPKDLNRYKANIPRLVTISGRQESAVERALDLLKSHPIDPEELALLHNIHEKTITGHLGKGFIILDTNADGETVSLSEKAAYFDGMKRPLWFVYSGMGSQWAGMGAQLMRIPIFAAAIERCRRVLEPKGIDIVHIITSPDKTTFNNILHSFVGIAAVQIGLTDILIELGLVPDKIIGHSVGELGCAYADGCLTAEEMILSAYSRGRVSLETSFIRGSMAAVGIGFQQMAKMCPPEIQIACHNSAESCTISGPADAMRAFVADLTAKGIFAKEVPCSNIAYHSHYIANAGPGLLKYLKEVIKSPKPRSERWVSTSVPQDKWDEPAAKYSSAEYHTHNLLNPVLFEESSALIPADAVLVEVAPHALLQAILKRSLPPSCTYIPLTRRGNTNNVLMVLDAVGKLFMEGYNPDVKVLYPKVEFPVSTGTPYLSHYVEWAHQDKWSLPLFQSAHRTIAASCTFVMSLHDGKYTYLKGHVIRNKTLLPFSFALVAAWDTLCMMLEVPKKSLSVQFRDVQFYAQSVLYNQKTIKLSVSIHRGNGRFEIMEEGSRVATGFIACMETPKPTELSEETAISLKNYDISASDVYRLLYEREYAYSGDFRSIQSANESLSEANVLWNDNWVAFIDGLIQINTLKYTHSGVSQPEGIGSIIVDVKKHLESIRLYEDTKNNTITVMNAQLSDVHDRTRCGGLILENLRFRITLNMNDDQITLKTLKFVPRYHSKLDLPTSLLVQLQIVAENMNKDKINVVGLSMEHSSQLFKEIKKLSDEDCIPGLKVHYRYVPIDTALQENENIYQNADVILLQNLLNNEKIYQSFQQKLQPNTFIINENDSRIKTDHSYPSSLYSVVSVLNNAKTKLQLARWRPTLPTATVMSAFTVRSDSDLHVLTHTRNSLSSQGGLIVLTTYPPISGLISLVKQWRKDSIRNRVHVIMINENSKDKLISDELPDVNLAYNIFDNGLWGGEYYLPLRETLTTANKKTLRSDTIGDVDSLRWVHAAAPTGTGTLVTVHYAGINLSDLKRATGLLPHHNQNLRSYNYGMEFSGITERGARVMGLAPNGAASSHVRVQPELMWPVPSYWSLEDAATVPFAYVFAYYCLKVKPIFHSEIKNKTQVRVLVHGGAGALGQAVISIALAKGYRVFTTVSDTLKKRFLLKLFPELNAHDIGNSRDAGFGDLVLGATNGKGCSVVICCLKGELKNASLKCCGHSGTVVDTVQILNNDKYAYGMNNMTSERSYAAVEISALFENPKSAKFQKLHDMVSDGIALGHVRPLSRVTFAPHEAPRAFRLLAASRHRGRVLLRTRDALAPAHPRLSPVAANCHIIACESSNPLGLQLANKLIDCGVEKLHLHFNNSSGSHIQYKLRLWKKLGLQVGVTHGNLNNMNDATNLVQNAMRLGSVEGLHVIADSILRDTVIANIDLATRTNCPSLKYFLLLSNDPYNCGHYISVQRNKSGLPVTLLDLSSLKTFQDADGFTWYHGAIEAAERALHSADPIFIAQTNLRPRLSLVQKIATLTDLYIPDETPKNTSLKQLGLSLEKSSSVSAFLSDIYNTSLHEEDIPSLTLERINTLENRTTEPTFNEVKGLKRFYSYVDPDELLATTDMVFLRTLTSNYNMRDDEVDMNDSVLCIVPGLEGHHARFQALCEHLKLPAFVLQPNIDNPDETPQELALSYSKVFLKKVGLKKRFFILGYANGIIIALELAAILEDLGQTGTVFCVGDGPEEMKALLEAEVLAFGSEEGLQESVVRHMFALMVNGSAAPVERALRGCSSWRARVDACVRTLRGRVSHSMQYARALVESAYGRIRAARDYSATPRALRSQLILLRARNLTNRGEASSLQRYSQRDIIIKDLVAPMAHVISDLDVPVVINRYIDSEILESFEKKNLCDTYYLNADVFMSSSESS